MNIKNAKNTEQSLSVKLLQSLLLVVTAFSVQADDTEVFFSQSEVNSNVIFIMDNSGSMGVNEVAGTTVGPDDVSIKSFPITNGNDDAEERLFSSSTRRRDIRRDLSTNRGSSDIGMTMDWKDDGVNFRANNAWQQQRIGLRFTDIDIPQGTEILSASIQFTADKDDYDMHSEPTNLNIAVEASNNASRYGGGVQNIGSRIYDNRNSVAWSPAPWVTPNEQGPAQKTPELKELVQMIVNQSGWQANNAIAFKIEGTGIRSAHSYNYARNKNVEPPTLQIRFRAIPGTTKTRMQVMQSALKIVLANPPTNLNVGIMNYGSSATNRWDNPNGIRFPAKRVNALARPIIEEALTVNSTVRWDLSNIPTPDPAITVGEFLSEIAYSWEPKGNTPIVDALYEAARYYRGDTLFWGNGKATEGFAAHPATYAHANPNEVLPREIDEVVEVCAGTPREKRLTYTQNNRPSAGERSGNYTNDTSSSIYNWDRGRTGGVNCPASVTSPVGPGSEANCPATTYGRGWRSVRGGCIRGIPARYGPDRCTTVDGVRNCRRGRLISPYRCDSQGRRPSKWRLTAKYKACSDSVTPIPAPHYTSPITAECQSNNIILMSDGKPEYVRHRNGSLADSGTNVDPHALSGVLSMISGSERNCASNSPFGFRSGRCGSELTHFLADDANDISTTIEGAQTVDTYVIGFSDGISDNAENYLRSLVTVSNGYFPAQNEEELAAAFKQTLDEISEEARSQASPGYSVNVKSGLEHEDDIYIPVFDKRNSSRWSGNLKKFKLVDDIGEDGDLHRSIRGKISTQSNGNANGDYVDAMTELGLFKDTAWDEWSTSADPDGDVVQRGGTASLLTNPRTRKLYSNLTSSSDLTVAGNAIKTTSAITTSMLGLDLSTLDNPYSATEISAYKNKLINFIRGWVDGIADPSFDPAADHNHGSARLHMGDMLHSEPVVITYQSADDAGNGKEQYIFAATNEGYLHVFDSSTGLEKFAFMPKELLKNVASQFTGEGEHKYGIDGQISYWHNDENKNGNVDGSEHVWLYFGMRRGGKSYYALDVTNIDRPILKWVVKGGTGHFADLGQTWSMPYIANVLKSGTKTPVVIFTGGNDIDQDYGKDDTYIEASVTGNIIADEGANIFIVDADTGNYLWDMQSAVSNASDVTHAIPGGARILDVNRNGLLDRMYFADTGGDVWRLDLGEDITTGTSILEKFATLGGTDANSRKFYNEPDVAMMRANGQLVYTVSIGSGMRPHPMNEIIDDHMFVLLDRSPLNALSSSYQPIVIGDLAKVAIGNNEGNTTLTHSDGFGVDNKKITDLEDSSGEKKKGWYLEFGDSGEKVLATSMTFEGSLMFTTLVPKALLTGELISLCATPATQGRIYIMDILTGEAAVDLADPDSDVTDNDVFQTISASEIPGTPQTVANQLECSGDSCTHLFDVRIGKKSTEVSASNVADVESIYWTDPIGK